MPEPPYYYAQYAQHAHYHDRIRPSHSTSGSIGAFPRPSPPRRSCTLNVYELGHQESNPWEHMATTYAWVLEQEIADMARKNEETVRWVHQQQERDTRREQEALRTWMRDGLWDAFTERQNIWDETMRRTMRWQRETERTVQDELRRLQAYRRDAERRHMAYEKRRAAHDTRERERREKERERVKACRDEAERAAWNTYEARWAALTSAGDSDEELTFHSVPWPMFSPPRRVEDITSAKIAVFILSPQHSGRRTRKERIRQALRRWHPDRFVRLLGRVSEKDRVAVEEGIGIVTRCLNNLLERES
ncbi:hypothetical protein A0H81_12888 [Grifola frondosa]|uniref:Uncharacterized protein n=1 Tax=Grifola frondosa TaxID=5627 RepID=A0A1C7LQX0_GRIFR|nr:hypothetical protein A0H81_12888 [Grifola frondosa]